MMDNGGQPYCMKSRGKSREQRGAFVKRKRFARLVFLVTAFVFLVAALGG